MSKSFAINHTRLYNDDDDDTIKFVLNTRKKLTWDIKYIFGRSIKWGELQNHVWNAKPLSWECKHRVNGMQGLQLVEICFQLANDTIFANFALSSAIGWMCGMTLKLIQ